MPTYRIQWRIKATEKLEDIKDMIAEIAEDLDFETVELKVSQVQVPGRKVDSEKTAKVKKWVEGRNKPFTSKVFESYTGLSRSSAHRRLSRLVQTGVYKKRWADGQVEYYRPSED